MKKIPVGATIAHACHFAFGDFFKILGVMWLPLAIMWLPGLLLQRQMMALSAQMITHDLSGLREILPIFVPLYFAAVILTFMQALGIAQLALKRRTGPSWFYFSLGKPLWRLIGSFLLLILAAIIGWLLVVLGSALIAAMLAGAGKLVNNSAFSAVAAIFAVLAIIALWCGYLYSAIRLTFLLTPVIAAEEEGFALGRSWTLGLGNFWRMFAILLVIFMPFLLLEGFVLFGIMFKGVPFPPSHASPDQIAAFQTAMNARALEMMNSVYHYWYIVYPLSIVVFVLLYGVSIGAQCFAYRALTEGEVSAPVAAD